MREISMKIVERLKKGSLVTDSTIVIVASLVANVFNYIFQLYIGRALGPVEYGVFSAVISLLYIFSVPAMTIQTTITKFVSQFKANGREDQIATLILAAIRKISIYSFLVFFIFFLWSQEIASFFKIPSRVPVILLGLILVTGSILPTVRGALAGIQRFWIFSANSILGAALKLFFGILLVSMGFGVNGALSSLIISNLLVFFVALIFLRDVFQRQRGNIEKADVYNYSAPVLLSVFLFTIISNVDIVLVKHFLSPEEAGYYAAASLLGKIIFFLAGPISFVMFPKASEEHTLKRRSTLLLRESLFYTLVISFLGVIAYFVSPSFIISSLFGSEFYAAVPLIGLFGIAMAFYSMSNVIIMFNMATKNMKFLPFLALATLAEAFLITMFHYDLITVTKIITLTMTALFAILLLINKEELLGSSQ
jgi:O-antigen/teichoic acid export membrane protein